MDHSGQGEGLIAYIRVWQWYNANASVHKYEHRMKVLSPDRCKSAAGVADATFVSKPSYTTVQFLFTFLIFYYERLERMLA